MTTYRIDDRVTVTYATHTGTWDGTVVNAFPSGDRLTYAVRPDDADPQHPGYTVEAEQMAPTGEQPKGGAR